MSELGIMLKKLRESKDLTIKELANKAKISNGTVGDIETGRNKSSIKTIEKLSQALELNEKERELLFASFMPKDIGKKLTKRDKKQLSEIIDSVDYFFNDESISEEDKKKLYDSLQELYFDAKSRNKRKK